MIELATKSHHYVCAICGCVGLSSPFATRLPLNYENLAGGVLYVEEIARLRKWISAYQVPHVPASGARILVYKGGVPVWELIAPDDAIPEMGGVIRRKSVFFLPDVVDQLRNIRLRVAL